MFIIIIIISGCPLGSFIYLLMMPALCTQWIMGSKYRTKLRKKYDLVEAPHTDIISHIFCPCCSLCQEFRELKLRGLDPALGISHPPYIFVYLFIFTFPSYKYMYIAKKIDRIKWILLLYVFRLEWYSGTKACNTPK